MEEQSMSKKFLQHLNGNKNGEYNQWLNEFKGEPRIAWYPSAGEDFRDILYLNPNFSKQNPSSKPDPQSPDIFIHTDYFPWSTSSFLDRSTIHHDDRTSITVKLIEELPRCNLPLDNKIVDFPQGNHVTGRVLFLKVNVVSNELGEFSVPVVYAFVENSVFCAKNILPQNAVFSHIIHVRYGGGCGGGGKSSGIWLLNILRKLQCECFITDSHYTRQSGDERTYELYPELSGTEDKSIFEQIRVVQSAGWSGHGDVSWNIVKPA
jgi:hypothetical protein